MRKYAVLFLVWSLQFFYAQKSDNIFNVPKGEALLEGNSINHNIWKSAAEFDIEGSGKIFLIHDNSFLYVGYCGSYEPWSHLYINNRSNVYVLHVTASMGRIMYNINNYGRWDPKQIFNWKMRHPEYDAKKKVDSEKFLAEEGWITANSIDNEKKEVVFKIALKGYDRNKLFIAFVYGMKGRSYLFWPATLNDDTLIPEQFTGYNPTDLKFDFKNWAHLKLSE